MSAAAWRWMVCVVIASVTAAMLPPERTVPTVEAYAGPCDTIARGGCLLQFGQEVMADIAPNETHQWLVQTSGPGEMTTETSGNVGDRLRRADQVEVAPSGADALRRLFQVANESVNVIQITPRSSVGTNPTPYKLRASYKPGGPSTIRPALSGCAVSMTGGFGKLLSMDATVAAKLGCPTAPEKPVRMARQAFERGYMLWRDDTDQIVVTFGDSSAETYVYHDIYREGEPESAPPAPPGLVSPIRGFGKLWTAYGLGTRLGWGKDQELGVTGGVQDFQSGMMLWTGTDQRLIWVVYNDGRALVVPDPNAPN